MGPGRDTAVLFAELLGATELYTRVGDAAAHAALVACANLLAVAAAPVPARLFKTIDSRLMVLARTPHNACRAAVAMQVAARKFEGDAAGLTLGIGFHFGPVIQDKSDIFGETVNVAARLVEQAAGGQILLAGKSAASVEEPFRNSIRRLYGIRMKGLTDELDLCELVWRVDELSTAPRITPIEQPAPVMLIVSYGETKRLLRRGGEELTLGRDPACGIVLDGEHTSRHHCTIQRRHDHFVLTDKSTNGTYVTVDGEDEVHVQRANIHLRKRGWIAFGRPRKTGAETVEFNCD